MLAGVKFIPRDQLNEAQESSDSDSSVKERRGSKAGGKNKHKRKKKQRHHASSKDDGSERLRSKQRKKWYSSGASSSLSESEDESSSDSKEKEHRKRKTSATKKHRRKERTTHNESSSDDMDVRLKKKSRRRKKRYSSDASSSSVPQSESDGYHDRRKNDVRKHQKKNGREKDKVKSRRKTKNGNDSSGDTELARKEMGLDWMLRPLNKPDTRELTGDDHLPEEPKMGEEVNTMNPKELNPYFRDSGSGFPDDTSSTKAGGNQLQPSSVVGDGGASWRLKALKRAQEQAAREGRTLDEVVGERWDSLGQMAVSVASHAAAPARAHLHAIKDRKRGVETHKNDDQMARGDEKVHGANREYLRDVSATHPEMREPRIHNSLSWRSRKGLNMSAEDTQLISSVATSLNKFSNDGSFLDKFNPNQNKNADGGSGSNLHVKGNEHGESELVSAKSNSFGEECSVSNQVLNANQLAAKVLQLRMKGKHEEAEKLLKESEAKTVTQNNGRKYISRGSTSRSDGRDISSQQKTRVEEDADMNLAMKIARNKQFSLSGQADDEYDFDDALGMKQSQKRGQVPESKLGEKRSIQRRILTQQERCQFCFDNPARPKHLIISIANFTYLMLPQLKPLVQGHCCILPMQHEASTRNLDDNVWEELRNFKKCLLRMFARQDKDVIFLETVMGLAQQRRHCLVECIPVPLEIAKEAPLYFKKAIDEAEDEWSQHNAKKLIDTSVKGLRGSIPKNFPYFHVEFGLSKGFVHVIDDEKQFKSSLGLNVIRGILRLPEEDMHRHRKHESAETQKKAVAGFLREWEPFDWTKELD